MLSVFGLIAVIALFGLAGFLLWVLSVYAQGFTH